MFNIKDTNIYIGDENDFFNNINSKNYNIINMAGNLHAIVLGYRPKPNDSKYILYRGGGILSVNFVDAQDPKYYDWQGNGIKVFEEILDFIDSHKDKKILINCNLGKSRSQSLAMLYLAKRLKILNNESFANAVVDFLQLSPRYEPGLGIQLFLTQNWGEIK
jgi:hypothetical protein